MTKVLALFVWITVFGAAAYGCGQSTRLNEGCNLATYGATDTKGFLAFDADLRAALTKQDANALALLVRYPLRVNEPGGGSYSINDGESLRQHFQDVFTPEVRKSVLNQAISSIFCKYDEGIAYGNGDVWTQFEKFGWAIWSVNVIPAGGVAKEERRGMEIICRTAKHRIEVDSDAHGILRYRSWNADHSVMERPDLEILSGTKEFQGTGVCASRLFTFKNGTTTFEIEGADGCYGDNDGPPPGATGHLIVNVAGKPESRAWCY